jgi:intracellular septation protein A
MIEIGRWRAIAKQLVPGMVLPGLVYFVLSHRVPTLVAVCAASGVPLLDALYRLLTRRAVNPVSLAFLAAAMVSVGLAVWSGSVMFVLARGAVISGVLAIAFGVSALLRRPLTRTLAIRLSSEHPEGRQRLAELWRQPKAMAVFRVLSLGWAGILLFQAVQQAIVVSTLPPGAVLMIEPPLQAAITASGIIASLVYARRIHASHPELGILAFSPA